jgi:hypothetical protein
MEGYYCLLPSGAPDSLVHHRATTVAVRCMIPFHIGRSRPLLLEAGWHTGQSGAPSQTLERATCRVDRADDRWPQVSLAHRTVRCPIGQSGKL